MIIILYPDNSAYPDNDIRVSIGTNDTFGVPAERPAIYPKGKDDVELYYVNGDVIKAFYTTLDQESRKDRDREYNLEYQRMMKDAQKQGQLTGTQKDVNKKKLCIKAKARRSWKDKVSQSINNLLQGNVCPINA